MIQNRGKKGYRRYFGIMGEDLDNKEGTHDLRAEEGAGSDKEETKKDRGRVAGNVEEGYDCGVAMATAVTPASDSSGRISDQTSQGNRALPVFARP